MADCHICKKKVKFTSDECQFCGASLNRTHYALISIILIITAIIMYFFFSWINAVPKTYPLAVPLNQSVFELTPDQLNYLVDFEAEATRLEKAISEYPDLDKVLLVFESEKRPNLKVWAYDVKLLQNRFKLIEEELQKIKTITKVPAAFYYLIENIKEDLEKLIERREKTFITVQKYLKKPDTTLYKRYRFQLGQTMRYRSLFLLNMVKLELAIRLAKRK